MKGSAKHKIVILGCGNLAWHIVKQLSTKNNLDITICNHQPNAALTRFKRSFRCEVMDDFKQIPKEADYYLICVSDKQIALVSKKIKSSSFNSLVVHCSGSMPLSSIYSGSTSSAVMYPLQSFSKTGEVDWSTVPLMLSASDSASLKRVKTLAALFSKHVFVLSDDERLRIHLAAVLVNNFSNALFVAAEHIVKENKKASRFKLLLPLIQHTVKKLEHMGPSEAQTGPAKRNDKPVLKAHLNLLKNHNEIKKVYQLMSRLIASQQQPNHA